MMADNSTFYTHLIFSGLGRHEWTEIEPTSVAIVDDHGTLDGTPSTITDMQTEYDGLIYHVNEAAHTPGIEVIVDFTNITAFNWLRVKGSYVGAVTHALAIQLYDWVTLDWHTKCTMPHAVYNTTANEEVIGNHECWIVDDTPYIGTGDNAGQIRIRLIHPMAGDNSHDLYIDHVALYQ